MIIRCQSDDRDDILSYMGTDYGKCLYLYLDLMQFGFDSPEVSVWKEEAADGRIVAIALVYHTTAHLFSREGEVDSGAWAELLRRMGVRLACAEAPVPSRLCGGTCHQGVGSEPARPRGVWHGRASHGNPR